DDDCDGRTDEDPELTAVEATCETGSPGRCADGTPACVGGAPACVAREQPGDEACNNVDDDCDGQTDEGLGTITCGVGACRVEAPICVAGAAGGCEPGRPAAEICNRIDDDCDGRIDELLGADPRLAGGVCETGLLGACALGALECDAGEVRCVPTEPAPELCNDVDDDCDDAIDEAIAPVTCGVGQCERTVSGCQDGVPAECIPGQSSA
ncbi:MAG: MopE-related protein, partial [Planctomycetota bacterium]